MTCLAQGHTDAGDEVSAPPPLTTLLYSLPRGNGPRPCTHRTLRGLQENRRHAETDGTAEEHSVRDESFRSARDRSGVKVLCGCHRRCLVCSRSLRPSACVAEPRLSPPLATQALPSSTDTLPRPGLAENPATGSTLPFLSTCSGYKAALAH